MNLDPALLSLAMLGCPMSRSVLWAPALDNAMQLFEIDTPVRAADFIAQLGHESAGLYYSSEVWGPTAEQARYERDFSQPWTATDPRNGKAFGLGNVNQGDGRLFAGHGPLQVTGRANHAQARDDLSHFADETVPDFEANPLLLTNPHWGALAAGNFWRRHNLNALADSGDFTQQTRVINGGTNGLSDRLARRVRARSAFGLAS